MKTLGNRVEELRKAKNISQIQLSTALGLPRMSVEKIEAGRLTPSKQQLEKIAKYFDVSTAYLNGSDEDGFMVSWSRNEEVSEPDFKTSQVVIKKVKAKNEPKPNPEESQLFSAFLKSEAFKQAVIDVLKTPEGKELIKKAMMK